MLAVALAVGVPVTGVPVAGVPVAGVALVGVTVTGACSSRKRIVGLLHQCSLVSD